MHPIFPTHCLIWQHERHLYHGDESAICTDGKRIVGQLSLRAVGVEIFRQAASFRRQIEDGNAV